LGTQKESEQLSFTQFHYKELLIILALPSLYTKPERSIKLELEAKNDQDS